MYQKYITIKIIKWAPTQVKARFLQSRNCFLLYTTELEKSVHIWMEPVKSDLEDHLKAQDKVLQKITKEELKVNAENSFFWFIETDYLSLWYNKYRVILLESKVDYIEFIDNATKVCHVRWSVGIGNYYWNMWCKRKHTLSPLKTYAPLK